MFNLKKKDKNKLISEIQDFFEDSRDEKIGIIAAEEVLDFFLNTLGVHIYNKSLDEAKLWISQKLEDIEIDYDMLYKERSRNK
ncbi:MAG: DUF2164 domain-containing protein [Vallitalea sp.]|jgi:uncharacterized protein (DUF2164 family)|nr:DUF2164 domain-containing protein [Vallitalea sp.]